MNAELHHRKLAAEQRCAVDYVYIPEVQRSAVDSVQVFRRVQVFHRKTDGIGTFGV